MTRLRIAFLSIGTFTHIGPYLRFFSERGHDVHWITITDPEDSFGVTVHNVSRGGNESGPRLAKWRYLLTIPRVRSLLRRIQPDLLHGHYATSAGLPCRFSAFRPYIISVRGSDLLMNLQSPVWRPLLRTVLTRAAMVHTVSDQLAATAAKEFGVPVDKCLVLTQGVDTKLFSYRVPRSENVTMRLLCTRSLNTVYDPLTILGACRRLKELGVSFEMTFAAGGPLQPEMEEVAASMQLSDCVRFIGGFRNEDLPSLLAMHDLYLSASLWDGTSISLLEAMSVGVLPIVSRIPSNHAWLEDGRTALMFDCGNIEELAQQLQRAAANSELRRTAAIENRRIVQSCADRWTNMARLEQMYYDVTDACAGSLTFPQAGST